MSITAQDVNCLRQETGAGMMDCKKALQEANGDFQSAIDILRKKGQKISAARQDREAKEGAIFARVSSDGTFGVMFELNSETDFVARNEGFQEMGEKILKATLATAPENLDGVKALVIDGRTTQDILTDAMGRIGEKIDVSKYYILKAEKVTCYIHQGAKVGVLVGFTGVGNADIEAIGKDVCLQIASMSPISVSKDDVDQSYIDREIEIGIEQARAEGKAENMLEKIAQGKLQRFYKDYTLLAQDFVKDPSKTVDQYLKDKSPSLKVAGFKRFHLG